MPSIDLMLIHRATILRRTRTRQGTERTEKFDPVAEGVPCKVDSPAFGTIGTNDGRLTADTARAAYFLPDQDVRQGDLVRIWTLDSSYLGEFMVDASGSNGAYMKAALRGQQPGFQNTGAPIG